MDKVRVALIGAGGMANAVHYPSLSDFADVEIVGLCDLVAEKLNATADRFSIERRYTDYKKMLDEVEPQAVYLLMPPHHLFDPAIEVLSRGLHLFIEKPPGVTTEQTRQMALLAERKGCTTMVGFQRRHIPLTTVLRRRVEERGPITQAVCTFYKHQIGAPPYYGGAIDALTCDVIHAVDFLRWVGGEVRAVASDIRNLYADYANSFNALISFKDGAAGVLLSAWTVGRRFFTYELHAKGISVFADPDAGAHLYAADDTKGEYFDAQEVAGSDQLHRYYGFYQENRHFIDCVKTSAEPTSSFSDAVKTMELVDRIYRSQI